jgi:PAS domain S-box-containing protein
MGHKDEVRREERDTLPDQSLGWLIDSIEEYAIARLTPEGIVSSWNAGARAITGYSAGEALGSQLPRFLPEAGSPYSVPKLLQQTLEEERAELEGWQTRKGGQRFWAIATLHPMRDSEGTVLGFGLVTRDGTARRATQEALLESERRFRLLVEGLTDHAIYMLDPAGVVTNWNVGAQRMKGYSSDEAVGQHFSLFYSREDRARGLPGRVLEIAAREGHYEEEGWRLRKDGSRFWASVVVDPIRDGRHRLIGFAKITRDISERRAAQEALKESERQFRRLVEGVRDYALYMLDPNGVIISWNSGAERIKGYSAAEIIGSHFSRFYVEDERAAGLPAKALAVAAREGRFESEGWRVRKDGSTFWANAVLDRIQDEKGVLVGYAKITRDITERRNAQLDLEEAQAQRSQAQKMESLGHLTGGVAHDFNNLLMIVSGQNRMLKRVAAENPRALKAIEAIDTAIARGASLTRQLLAFSRRQILAPQMVALEPRIEAFKTMLAATMGGLSIVTSVPPGIWPVRADPNELELALLNLAINARDAMEQRGTLTIAAENRQLKREETAAGLEGAFVALNVTDTGTGIAPDVLLHIFEPFHTTKDVHKGSGLGLSQVHGFAHQSGGTVMVSSMLGQGTTVTLFLPKCEEAIPGSAPEIVEETEGRGRILVVEDNPDVAAATRVMLEELGYDVEIAGDGHTALDDVARQIAKDRAPRLVLSDVVMPGPMDGLALARELARKHPTLPVLLITGYDRNAAAGTEFPVVRKPVNLNELGRAVRSAIAAKEGNRGNVIRLRP